MSVDRPHPRRRRGHPHEVRPAQGRARGSRRADGALRRRRRARRPAASASSSSPATAPSRSRRCSRAWRACARTSSSGPATRSCARARRSPASTARSSCSSGDTPLLRAETIAGLVAMREARGAACTVLTTRPGRTPPATAASCARATTAASTAIVEEKDCTAEQRRIDEVNTGTYCFDAARALRAPRPPRRPQNAQGEYYLTDMIAGLPRRGADRGRDARPTTRLETLGVNTPRAARRGDQGPAAPHQPGAHARRRHDDRPRPRVDRTRRDARPRRRARCR